ncbi:hypothetical protein [Marinobacter nauticus]|uniref:hypothetical protein n=1 Tax=Marinobacter nauticus TaxID=2743 RepID=UPI000EB131F5|nr:hypothetical protein [Marinobacter nauticus]RKR79226.1 hypothetical protein C7436_0664 [Marinobacter nauticus]
MTETPETIYLIPGEDIDGAPCMVWCEDPAPGEGMDPADAVKYIRAGSARAIERDVAFRQRDLAYRQRDEIELKWSKAGQQLRESQMEADRVKKLAEKIRDIAIDSPASNNMQLIYRLACQQAEHAGGDQ